MDVWYFGAPNAVVYPANHIAQDSLNVVVELLIHLCRRPVGRRHGNRQKIVELASSQLSKFALPRCDIDVVIMDGVQGCRGR